MNNGQFLFSVIQLLNDATGFFIGLNYFCLKFGDGNNLCHVKSFQYK
jgi:hypothetical protein